MAKGFSFTTFAAVINVNRDTIYNWEKLFPAFSDAKKIAFDRCQHFWEQQGLEGMWNKPYDKTLNSAIWIYNMKCRFPKDFLEKKQAELPPEDSEDEISDQEKKLEAL